MDRVKQLLSAIEEDDDNKFETITQDMELMIREVATAEKELSDLKVELVSVNIKYTDAIENKSRLVSEIVQLQEQINSTPKQLDTSVYEQTISSLNSKIEILSATLKKEQEKPDYSEELDSLKHEIEELERQLSEKNALSSVDIAEKYSNQIETVKQANEKLQSTLVSKNEEVTKLVQEISVLKSKPAAKEESVADLEKIIKQLRMKINEASSDEEQREYPIITQSMKLKADSIVVFKEIKSCIYMNSLIDYVASYFCVNNNTEAHLEQGYRFILVLDPLVDETTKLKYLKHKFPINENFKDIGCKLPLLITNKSQEDIMKIVDLSIYSKIVVVDRFKRLESAVKRKGVDTYYSIDSPTDPSDYNLSTSKCVGFFKDSRSVVNSAVNTKTCGYFVNPSFAWDDRLDPEDGCTCMMASVQFVAQVLCDDYSAT